MSTSDTSHKSDISDTSGYVCPKSSVVFLPRFRQFQVLTDFPHHHNPTGVGTGTVTVVECWDRGDDAKEDNSPIDPTYLGAVEGDRNIVGADGSTDIDLGCGAIHRFPSVGATDKEGAFDNSTDIRGKDSVVVTTEDNKSIRQLGGSAEGEIKEAVDVVDVLHVDHLGGLPPAVCITSFWNKTNIFQEGS